MNVRKISLIVLATVVIFGAGVVTGGLVVSRTAPAAAVQPFWNRFEMARRAVKRMPDLTQEQRVRIDHIIRDSQELIADYFHILEPDVRQVFGKMRIRIRAELSPDQRDRFEVLARQRPSRAVGRRPAAERSTNLNRQRRRNESLRNKRQQELRSKEQLERKESSPTPPSPD